MNNDLKSRIELCKTGKQVLKILKENGINILKDDSDEVGTFSVWIDEYTRIYKPMHRNMVVQMWRKVSMNYSGIPVYFE